jgi:hypothetical protein
MDTVVVCTEYINPHIMVVKSAEDWRFYISSPLNGTRDRRIFVQ